MKNPQNGETYLDLVLAEEHIVDIKQETSPVSGKTFNVYRVKDEHKYSFNSGMKDSFALFHKLPELISDFKSAFLTTQPRLMIEPFVDASWVLHRKVVTLSKP